MSRRVIAVTSHKGGSGRTTTILALAGLWQEWGLSVGLMDADPEGLLRTHLSDAGSLKLLTSLTPAESCDVVLMECPSLADPAASAALMRVTDVLLTTTADVLSLRTLPGAVQTLNAVCRRRGGAAFQGILLVRGTSERIQTRLRAGMRETHPELFIGDIPHDPALAAWLLHPGESLPPGAGREAYVAVAEELGQRVNILANQGERQS